MMRVAGKKMIIESENQKYYEFCGTCPTSSLSAILFSESEAVFRPAVTTVAKDCNTVAFSSFKVHSCSLTAEVLALEAL